MDVGIALIIVAALVVVVALFVALTYNALKAGQFACDDAWSLIDVQLARRASLVPNLVETARGYAAHERALQEALAAVRSEGVTRQGPSAEAAAVETAVGRSAQSLLGLAEQYPDLAASEHFLKLQRELDNLEDQIAASREIYNGNVASYRTRRQQVPTSLVASWFSFADRELFRLEDPRDAFGPRVTGFSPTT